MSNTTEKLRAIAEIEHAKAYYLTIGTLLVEEFLTGDRSVSVEANPVLKDALTDVYAAERAADQLTIDIS